MGLGLLLLLGSLLKINNWCDYYSSGVLIVFGVVWGEGGGANRG